MNLCCRGRGRGASPAGTPPTQHGASALRRSGRRQHCSWRVAHPAGCASVATVALCSGDASAGHRRGESCVDAHLLWQSGCACRRLDSRSYISAEQQHSCRNANAAHLAELHHMHQLHKSVQAVMRHCKPVQCQLQESLQSGNLQFCMLLQMCDCAKCPTTTVNAKNAPPS